VRKRRDGSVCYFRAPNSGRDSHGEERVASISKLICGGVASVGIEISDVGFWVAHSNVE